MIKRLSEYFLPLREEELIHAVYLSIARVSSESNGVEMNIGENILLKALSKFSTTPIETLRQKMKEKGDISTVVTVGMRPRLFFAPKKTLFLSIVFLRLEAITKITGKESTAKKIEEIAGLLAQCTTNEEIKYIIRIIDGKMKIGLNTQSVLCSLGLALQRRLGAHIQNEVKTGKDPQNLKKKKSIKTENISEGLGSQAAQEFYEPTEIEGIEIDGSQIEWTPEENVIMEAMKEAYSQLPAFDRIIRLVFTEGLSALFSSLVTPGYPLWPMLAIAEKDPETSANRFKDGYLVEYKYDGERVQAHFFNGKVELFSRGLENTTERFQQLVPALKEANKTQSDFIVDAEVVAYCRRTSRILSFQTLSNRKRKLTESNADKEESDIALFIFDLIYLGKSLNKLPILKRKQILKDSFTEIKGKVEVAESYEFKEHNIERLNQIFTDSLAAGCEGLMIKSADASSTYEPSKRSQKWIKLKSDYITGLHETLDLVVIGGYTGKGKRTGVFGGFLLGCIGEFGIVETITKIGTGFSEVLLEEISKTLREYVTSVPQSTTSTTNAPDVWFKPKVIWEVAAAGFSISPQYTAGMGAPELPEGRGLSLRFPRFMRKREDKTLETATTSEQILYMFRQTARSN